ncbi:centrosomal protein of 131 kDa-like [Tubulanus polymorphus]|uniref:centrosomal protein of 131 kDa-like n=1 Tax=Tubulanus polymorphus TaxID=672921 RepID=UPI003DA2FC97
MAGKNTKSNTNDMALSLTGMPVTSVKRPNSSRSSVSGSGRLKEKSSSLTSLNIQQSSKSSAAAGDSSKKHIRTSSQNLGSMTPDNSTRRNTGKLDVMNDTTSDDFLALFENSVQPKIKSKRPQPGAMSSSALSRKLHSSKSTNSKTVLTSNVSQKSGNKKFQHSVFQPNSARSTSSVETDYIDASPSNSHRAVGTTHGNECQNNATANTLSPSIANNMTSQAMSPTLKMPFTDIENAYQNIRHDKTPVNLVKNGSHNSSSSNNEAAENYIKRVNMAATRIQRWYRCASRERRDRRSNETAMKQLFDEKRTRMREQRRSQQMSPRSDAEDRRKHREEKAQKARQQAIKELQQRQLEKAAETKLKAEEDLKALKEEGKLGRSRNNNSKSKSKKDEKPRINKNNLVDDMGEVDSIKSAEESRAMNQLLNYEQNNGAAAAVAEASGDIAESSISKATTLSDLMDTLKKLEEDEMLDPSVNVDQKKKRNTAWDDLDKTLSGSEENDFLSPRKLAKHNSTKPDVVEPQLMSDEKLRSIFNFLDEVDRVDRLTVVENQLGAGCHDDLEKPPLLLPSSEELADIEQATSAANEVTATVLKQRLELDEKKRSVTILQKALNQQRELTIRHAKETEKDMKKRLSVQKVEYEETIKRHLSFIDQLIDDKKILSEKCENLLKELKTMERKFSEKIKQMEESHAVEMSKIKDINAAAEKLRREKWIDEKTKKIKEMTVKGLEPEIQRLIAKHKSEIKKMKSIHEAELLESDERAGQRYVKMTEELRDQLAMEKEAACARERELAKQRYEKQMQQEEEAYQAQRRRMYSEIQEEKDRLAQQAIRQRAEIDKLQRQLEDTHTHSVSAMKAEYEKAREEQERRHATETKELHERLRIEKEAWEANYMKKQETWLLQKERELKENVRKDRDKEIELVIGRLEDDTIAAREESERVADNRIKRIRDKYESEMSELERSERQAMEKYNEMKAKLTEVEGENERLKVIIKQKDQEIKDAKKSSEKLHSERDHVSDIIRQEFADRIVATDEENKRVKNEMSEQKAKHRIELERAKSEIEVIQKAKEEEMEEVHKRVKQAILKKEDVVTQLRQQYQAAVKRADHLEGLLEQQRKQLLRK